MFSYYGSKAKLAKYYPKPTYPLVIEPFAGAAWYSIVNKSKLTYLLDINPTIAGLWKWDFLGFSINRGTASPRNIVQKWSAQVTSRPTWASTTRFAIDRAISLLPLIKNWTITQESYERSFLVEATWFIDPPYQHGGNHYKFADIDYIELAKWVSNLKGQVIVCGSIMDTWLPFEPLSVNGRITGQRSVNGEAVCLIESR